MAIHDNGGELEDVATNRIGYLNGCRGVRELAGIAGIAEMIEKGFAEHVGKYGKRSSSGAMRQQANGQNLRADYQRTARAQRRGETMSDAPAKKLRPTSLVVLMAALCSKY